MLDILLYYLSDYRAHKARARAALRPLSVGRHAARRSYTAGWWGAW